MRRVSLTKFLEPLEMVRHCEKDSKIWIGRQGLLAQSAAKMEYRKRAFTARVARLGIVTKEDSILPEIWMS